MSKKANKKRLDGRVAASVYMGIVNGKKKYKTVYGSTSQEAEIKAQEIKNRLGKGLDVLSENRSFKYWSELYLKYEKANVTDSVYKTYKYQIEYFNEFIGNKEIIKIHLFELQDIINEYALKNPVTKKPSSKKSVIKYIATFKHIFNFAIDNKQIEFNPASNLKIPRCAAKAVKRDALNEEQKSWVLDTPHRAQTAAMIMLYTGIRRGELTALTWNDIDFENKVLTVNKNYDFRNKILKEPKTEAGKRNIPIPDILIDYLSKVEKTDLLVITSKNKTMMLEGSWTRLWDDYLNCLNLKYGGLSQKEIDSFKDDVPLMIKPFTPHCLRHTYCTMLYDAGVDVMTAKYLMGHEKIETTLNIYTHLSENKEKKGIEKLNDFLNDVGQNVGQKSEIR